MIHPSTCPAPGSLVLAQPNVPYRWSQPGQCNPKLWSLGRLCLISGRLGRCRGSDGSSPTPFGVRIDGGAGEGGATQPAGPRRPSWQWHRRQFSPSIDRFGGHREGLGFWPLSREPNAVSTVSTFARPRSIAFPLQFSTFEFEFPSKPDDFSILPYQGTYFRIMASSVFHLAPLPNPPVPLPRVPGPKLAPFTPNARANIEFVEFLGEKNNVDSQVWKVKIKGAGQPRLFALKTVRDETRHIRSAPAQFTRNLTRSALPSFTSATQTFSVRARAGTLRGHSPTLSSMPTTLTLSTVSAVPMADSRKQSARTWPPKPTAISSSPLSRKPTWPGR